MSDFSHCGKKFKKSKEKKNSKKFQKNQNKNYKKFQKKSPEEEKKYQKISTKNIFIQFFFTLLH